MTFEQIPSIKQLSDKRWRLQNLYRITDKKGNEIDFSLNWAQEELYDRRWFQMLVLKARQLGCTTFFAISFLDDCFWYPNTASGIIADKKESSEEIFKKKVKFAYDRMPEWTRAFNQATNDRVGELTFRNGSSYRVSTGFRSGTYQRLLVSEFGKICAKSPDVAREIVTGSLNTVARDQIIVIESTAEGREGYFYEFSQEAEKLAIEKKKLSPMQQRFFFFPWFREPSYREKDETITIPKEINEYMDIIEGETGRKIDEEQRRWYHLKQKILQDSMKQEYPSTPKEAFESANEGLYYGQQMAKLRSEGRICRVPYNDHSLVHTAWDIGLHDYTAIWIFQVSSAGEVRVLDYYENNGEPAVHYVDWLKSKPFSYGSHILPHDAENGEKGTGKSYVDIINPLIKGDIIVLNREECKVFHGIQIVRSILSRCVFDETKCMLGVKRLESYKKEWNDKLGCFRNSPLHDEASHGCFIGETLIDTKEGKKRIDEVKVGDLALTPNGYKKVLNVFQYESKNLITIKAKNYSFTCTNNHKIFTEKGLVYADALRYNDTLFTNKKADRSICQRLYGSNYSSINIGFRENFSLVKMNHQSSLMGIDIDGMDITIQGIKQKRIHFQDYIERYGDIITEKFQKIIMSITKMVIQKITALKILNSLVLANIPYFTEVNLKEGNNPEKQSRKLLNMLKIGMLRKREENGIEKMEKNHSQKRYGLKRLAYVAETNIQLHGIMQNSAQINAKPKTESNINLILKNVIVRFAEKYSGLINTLLRRPVVKNVELNLPIIQKVYDIEVEDDHCYYANGILVSNSDAFRYLCVGLSKIDGPKGSIENDMKAIRAYFGG